MRSVLGAMWQFTVAFGDLIVVLVTQFQGKSKQVGGYIYSWFNRYYPWLFYFYIFLTVG